MFMPEARAALWRLAFMIALDRVGVLALPRAEDGAYMPPTEAVKADPEGTRKARRRYRKLWRRALARELKEFERAPPRRRRKHWAWIGAFVKGVYKAKDDPFDSVMLLLRSVEVGCSPRRNARGARWQRVKQCHEVRRELLKAAQELGLVQRRGRV
jgi:hypothetical protein